MLGAFGKAALRRPNKLAELVNAVKLETLAQGKPGLVITHIRRIRPPLRAFLVCASCTLAMSRGMTIKARWTL